MTDRCRVCERPLKKHDMTALERCLLALAIVEAAKHDRRAELEKRLRDE